MNLQLATHEQGERIFAEANEWFAPAKYIWNDAKTPALTAVAEYIANQRGLTLYTSRLMYTSRISKI